MRLSKAWPSDSVKVIRRCYISFVGFDGSTKGNIMTTSSYESLSHSKWDCIYHIVFIPKGRKKALYGKIRKFLGSVFHQLAKQRGSTIIEGHMVQDHVHMLIKIPPKYSVSQVIGYIKGKSAIAVARQFGGRQKISMERGCGLEATQFLQLGLRKLKSKNTLSNKSSSIITKAAMSKDRFN